MLARLKAEVAWFGRTVTPAERRFASWIGWASVVVIVGLTVTGVWQFLSHEPDPDWFRYSSDREQNLPSKPSTGGAELHGLFADAAFVIALFGGAWFAYKVLYRVPRFAVVAALVTLSGNITGSIVRFNAVKVHGKTLEQAANGYAQIFLDDLEFVVNGRLELGSLAIRLFMIGHVITVAVLVIAGWFTLTGARRARERDLGVTSDPSAA